MIRPAPAFVRFAWGVLAYTVAVVLWGAYVRATGSGAGCGAHWPLCNGVVVPRAPATATLIELTHRVTSGLSLALIGALGVWGMRAYPSGHPVRGLAAAAVALIVSEALIGAGLVLFGLVADDRSGVRAMSLAVHLTNTFFLLASLALTATAATRDRPLVWRGSGLGMPACLALGGCLLVGITGAITALGDTLFPVASVTEGFAQDAAPGAHLLLRLRVYHPVLALAAALGFLVYGQHLQRRADPGARIVVARHTNALLAVVTAQVVAGVLNVILLAPVWLQLLHLLLADLLWITLVLLTAAAL